MINLNDKYGYVTEEINRQGYQLIKIDNKWHSTDDSAVQAIIDSYDPVPDARAEAILRINEQSQTYMQAIEDEYPEFEKRTWPTQKEESEAWTLDNNALTPTLDTIALARVMDRVVLIQKTYNKVQDYAYQAATLAGKRQKIEDEIKASNDLDFICNVNFEA